MAAAKKDTKAQEANKEPEVKAGEKDQPTPPATTPEPPAVKPAKQVKVIIPKGMTLGRRMLVNGDVTDDPDYVALLDVPGQKKVEAVE